MGEGENRAKKEKRGEKEGGKKGSAHEMFAIVFRAWHYESYLVPERAGNKEKKKEEEGKGMRSLWSAGAFSADALIVIGEAWEKGGKKKGRGEEALWAYGMAYVRRLLISKGGNVRRRKKKRRKVEASPLIRRKGLKSYGKRIEKKKEEEKEGRPHYLNIIRVIIPFSTSLFLLFIRALKKEKREGGGKFSIHHSFPLLYAGGEI